jgi:hypothetical protein
VIVPSAIFFLLFLFVLGVYPEFVIVEPSA